jgi:hypothetical protein
VSQAVARSRQKMKAVATMREPDNITNAMKTNQLPMAQSLPGAAPTATPTPQPSSQSRPAEANSSRLAAKELAIKAFCTRSMLRWRRADHEDWSSVGVNTGETYSPCTKSCSIVLNRAQS